MDLYYFLHLLRPDIFDSYAMYAWRYWNAKFDNTRTLYLNDDKFSKVKELNLIIYEKFLVRTVNRDRIDPRDRILVRIALNEELNQAANNWIRQLVEQKQRTQNKGCIVSWFRY